MTIVQEKLGGYKIKTLSEFVDNFLPLPHAGYGEFKFFWITSSDNCTIKIWGISEQDVINEFNKFLTMEMFL